MTRCISSLQNHPDDVDYPCLSGFIDIMRLRELSHATKRPFSPMLLSLQHTSAKSPVAWCREDVVRFRTHPDKSTYLPLNDSPASAPKQKFVPLKGSTAVLLHPFLSFVVTSRESHFIYRGVISSCPGSRPLNSPKCECTAVVSQYITKGIECSQRAGPRHCARLYMVLETDTGLHRYVLIAGICAKLSLSRRQLYSATPYSHNTRSTSADRRHVLRVSFLGLP